MTRCKLYVKVSPWALVTMSSIQSKKRKHADLETKYNALREVSLGKKSKQAIAQEAGIPPCTLSHWIRYQQRIEDAFTQSKFDPKRKRMRTSRRGDLDEAVDNWLREQRSKNVHISGTLLQETARDLAAKMGIKDFKGDNGWLNRFKKRKGLSLRTLQREAREGKVSQEQAEDFVSIDDNLETSAPLGLDDRTDEPIDDEEDPEAACEKSRIFNATRQTSITTFFKGKYSTVYDT